MSEQLSPPPAPGEDRSPALALVNTEIEPRGQRVDLLPDGVALSCWLGQHGLRVGRRGRVGGENLARIQELRSAIRLAFTARAAGQAPPRRAIATINTAAGLVGSAVALRWTEAGPQRETVWAPDATAADRALAQLAADAIATLLGPTGERLRLCEAHGCNRMFIQDHRRRRWCSRSCGDRVRVARHYRKTNRRA
jgi:predicted RNA-binding Zn ribbon-like protein